MNARRTLLLVLLLPAIARGMVAEIQVYYDQDGDGRRGPREPGVPEALVSDGDHLRRTDAGGRARLDIVAENGHGRRVFVIIPGGHRPTTPWHLYLDPRQEQPVACAFGLAAEAEPTLLRFCVASDPQVTIADAGAVAERLTADFGLAEPGALGLILGDITERGAPAELEAWRNSLPPGARVFCAYGAKDGAAAEMPGIAAFESVIGPAWYAFWRGGRLFVVLASEPAQLSGLEQARQQRWLRRLALSLPDGAEVLLFSHVPPAEPELELLGRCRLRAVFYGHWHENAVWRRGDVPMIAVGPYRGSEWGAGTGCLRLVTVTEQTITADVRRAAMRRSVTVLSPSPLSPPTRDTTPLHVVIDDTGGVSAAALTVGERSLPLARVDAHNWRLEAPLTPGVPAGLKVTGGRGETWEQTIEVPARAAAATVDPAGPAPRPPLRRAWLTATGRPRIDGSSPRYADGRLFLPIADDDQPPAPAVAAFDALSGAVLWRQPTDGSVRRDLVCDGERVYALTHLNAVHAFAAADGRPVWKRDVSTDHPGRHRNTRCGLGLAAGRLLVQIAGGPLLALDPRTGDTVAKATVGGAHLSVPTVSATQILVPAFSGLASLDPVTLETRWRGARDESFPRHGPVVLAGSYAYLLTPDLLAFDAITGEIRWRRPLTFRGALFGGVAVDDGVVYTPGARPGAFATTTGAPQWTAQPLPDFAGATPALTAEHLWSVDDRGALIAYRRTDGEEVWRADFGVPLKSSPLLVGNAIVLADGYGNLHALTSEPAP